MEAVQYPTSKNKVEWSQKIAGFISRKRAFRIFLMVSLFAWCFGFSFNSLFNGTIEAGITYPFLKKIFHIVCHQLDEKTFTINGAKLLVCARCTGIYLGGLASSITSVFYIRRFSLRIKLLYISMLPMLIDVAATSFKIYNYSKPLAFSTGIFFGSVVFIYILSAIENNFTDKSF